jgi:hypothetical protein
MNEIRRFSSPWLRYWSESGDCLLVDKLIPKTRAMRVARDSPGLPICKWSFCCWETHQICEIGMRLVLIWSTDRECWTQEPMDLKIYGSIPQDGTEGGQQIRILLLIVWIPPRMTISDVNLDGHTWGTNSGTHSIFHTSKLAFNMYPDIPQD